MSTESAYTEKAQKNKMVDLWHARLGHVSLQQAQDYNGEC